MYVSLFDIDLNHITNLSNITGTLITKVYDFDEIKLSGNDTMGVNINDLNRAKLFRLNEDNGTEIYSGFVYKAKKKHNTVEIIGNDFLTYLDTDVFLDYKNYAPPIIIYSIFRIVTDQLKNAPPLEVRIPLNFIIPLDDLGIDFREVFGELPLEMFGTNGYKYMLPFLKYYGVRIIASYDWADDSPINFEFTRDRNTHKIRLKDFTFDLSQNQPTINKTLAIMTGGNPISDPEWSRYYYLTTDNQIVQGNYAGQYQKISETDLEIADYYITDTLKNRTYDDNGTLMLEQKVGKRVFVGDTTEGWSAPVFDNYENTYSFYTHALEDEAKPFTTYQNVACNLLPYYQGAYSEDVEGIEGIGKTGILYISVAKSKLPTESSAIRETRFKWWLQQLASAGTPFTVYYELENPIIRPVETTMVDIPNRYYPVKTKIFIEDYLANAQHKAVYELANNRYVDSITIDANSPLNPIDLSKVGLFDLIEIYDTDYQKTLPVSEKHLKISEKGIEFKLKLGFKKERLTEIIRYTT